MSSVKTRWWGSGEAGLGTAGEVFGQGEGRTGQGKARQRGARDGNRDRGDKSYYELGFCPADLYLSFGFPHIARDIVNVRPG